MTSLVALRGVSKTFPHTHRPKDRLRALIHILIGREISEGSTVLKDIDLSIESGQSMAVIGENGAGKSTLLKILTGVLRPTTGHVSVNATIAALLELGAGFQPEFTGLENVRIKATLLGLSRQELRSKLDGILDFADIGEYINEPVKHYSSGMVVRLGFAVITAVNPELLVTDEILAVGDESFQKKCIRWIQNYLDSGGTLMMGSHNMYQVQKLCQQACWIHGGGIHMQGDVFKVTQSYLAYHEEKTAKERVAHRQETGLGGLYQIRSFAIVNGLADSVAEFRRDDDLVAELLVEAPDGRAPVALIGIARADGTPVYGVSSDETGTAPKDMGNRRFKFSIRFNKLSLLPGNYTLRAHALDPEGLRLFDTAETRFIINGASRELGLVRLPHEWNGSS